MVLYRRQYGRVGGCQYNTGGVAQLGEHLPCKQGVKSSNLSISTGRELGEYERKRRMSLVVAVSMQLVKTSVSEVWAYKSTRQRTWRIQAKAKYEPSRRHVNALNEYKRKPVLSLVVDQPENNLCIVPWKLHIKQ